MNDKRVELNKTEKMQHTHDIALVFQPKVPDVWYTQSSAQHCVDQPGNKANIQCGNDVSEMQCE